MKKKIYLLGPITNAPENNYRYFHFVQRELERLGYEVINPHEILEAQEAKNMHDVDLLNFEVRELTSCNEVVTLKGWEDNLVCNQINKIARILLKPITHVSKLVKDK